MSWLNTSSIASLAKSALKEAQKTIDKALDISEEVNTTITSSVKTTNTDETATFNSNVMTGTEAVVDNHDVFKIGFWNTLSATLLDPMKATENQTDSFEVVKERGSSEINEYEPTINHSGNKAASGSSLDLRTVEETDSGGPCLEEPKPTTYYFSKEQERNLTQEHNEGNSSPVTTATSSSLELSCSEVIQPASEEEPSNHESYHSSVSASSSITVVNPQEDSFLDAGSFSRPSSSELNCDVVISEEVSTMLSEAMKDSAKTEHSASISGDEIETTTSSDIEIIASPQSGIRKTLPPVPNNYMTHHRQPSEASSDDSLSTALDVDKMRRKVTELNQLLEVRENKVLEMSRKCSELMDEVEQLKLRLANDDKERVQAGESFRRQTEEFAQRLSAVEKRYQQVLAERNALLAQLETVKHHQNVSEELKEKEEVIKELRIEGEKLSKQHLQHCNIIKKLRAKEKEDEQQIKSLKEKNEEMTTEVERLKKVLAVKEELEKNQIEAVRQLTSANSALEKEMEANKFLLRDLNTEVESLKKALTEASKELAELRNEAAIRQSAETERNLSVEISLRQRLEGEFETSKRMFEEEKLALNLRCGELMKTLATVDSERSREKEQTRNEISRLMQRLQDAESRSEELTQALTTATRPLLRQIETLQASLISQRKAEENSKNILDEKLSAFERLQQQLQAATQKEAATKDVHTALQNRIDELSERINSIAEENRLLSSKLAQEETRSRQLEQDATRQASGAQIEKGELEKEILSLKSKLRILEHNYDLQTAALEEEKRKSAKLMEPLHEKEHGYEMSHANLHHVNSSGSEKRMVGSMRGGQPNSQSSSPTPSLGKLSLSGSFTESHSSNPWISTDEVFDGNLATPVPNSTLYDTMRGVSYTTVFESLESKLKTRDGEVIQLQQELMNQEKTRDSLAKELAQMINSNQVLNSRLEQLESVVRELGELKTSYNALLQMYGEKIEENEELRLDLLDVKEMYKAQIDQLMRK